MRWLWVASNYRSLDRGAFGLRPVFEGKILERPQNPPTFEFYL